MTVGARNLRFPTTVTVVWSPMFGLRVGRASDFRLWSTLTVDYNRRFAGPGGGR